MIYLERYAKGRFKLFKKRIKVSTDKEWRAPGGNNQRWKPKLGYRNHFPSHLSQVTCTHTHTYEGVYVRPHESNNN